MKNYKWFQQKALKNIPPSPNSDINIRLSLYFNLLNRIPDQNHV